MGLQKRRRRGKRDRLVLKLLILVTLVLVVFEGRLIVTMMTHRAAMSSASAVSQSVSQDSGEVPASAGPETSGTVDFAAAIQAIDSGAMESTLAGLSTSAGSYSTGSSSGTIASVPTVSDPDNPAIVPAMATPVDDSYFSDAAFIGDSRMEGFRMTSGITQGQFFTSVGMSLSSMRSDAIIQTSDGNITVAAALSGGLYNKIYIMLGTNDLGEYDWPSFQEGFVSVIDRFQEIQPDAIFYICSVIYVDESKVYDTSYINNANVDTINTILLDVCEGDENCYYLNLNEIFSNGYGSLLPDASSDGVHLEAAYCEEMLNYLKSHYIEADTPEIDAEEETKAEADADA